MNGKIDPSFFHAEATLRPDLPCYVERRADAELLVALRDLLRELGIAPQKLESSCVVCATRVSDSD